MIFKIVRQLFSPSAESLAREKELIKELNSQNDPARKPLLPTTQQRPGAPVSQVDQPTKKQLGYAKSLGAIQMG